MAKEHDHSYKLLFSHADMVKDLLLGFVPQDWLDGLDFDSLTKGNNHYVTDDLREREGDVVWKIRWRHGQKQEWIYIYILVEFQSKIEKFMSVRVLNYLTLLYQDLIKNKNLGKANKLPPVLPIVLYNGSKRWKAPNNIQALMQVCPPALQPFQPQGEFLLIDEGRYSNQALSTQHNLVAALFRLENSQSKEDIEHIVRLQGLLTFHICHCWCPVFSSSKAEGVRIVVLI